MSYCADCEESSYACVVCGKGVCPVHRHGTGDLSLGYACVSRDGSGCSLMLMGSTRKAKLTIFERYGLVPVLASIFLVGWFAIGLIHFIVWRHFR